MNKFSCDLSLEILFELCSFSMECKTVIFIFVRLFVWLKLRIREKKILLKCYAMREMYVFERNKMNEKNRRHFQHPAIYAASVCRKSENAKVPLTPMTEHQATTNGFLVSCGMKFLCFGPANRLVCAILLANGRAAAVAKWPVSFGIES